MLHLTLLDFSINPPPPILRIHFLFISPFLNSKSKKLISFFFSQWRIVTEDLGEKVFSQETIPKFYAQKKKFCFVFFVEIFCLFSYCQKKFHLFVVVMFALASLISSASYHWFIPPSSLTLLFSSLKKSQKGKKIIFSFCNQKLYVCIGKSPYHTNYVNQHFLFTNIQLVLSVVFQLF